MRSEEELRFAIEQYGDMVKKICFIHMKQQCDVDDVFQNVFLKYANASSFESREHEKAWLIRVSINACKDNLRVWFRKNVSLHNEMELFDCCNHTLPDAQHPEVLQSVLKLKNPYKSVIYLYYYEGYNTSEIAKILKRKDNTIQTWLRRSREQLKGMLGGDDFA
ncbi:MAG: sigma-70 family RNA polymerase sigma factor [Longicatena sp.]